MNRLKGLLLIIRGLTPLLKEPHSRHNIVSDNITLPNLDWFLTTLVCTTWFLPLRSGAIEAIDSSNRANKEAQLELDKAHYSQMRLIDDRQGFLG
jgi:hypothetical protein